jgi:hypothetical protein
MAEKEIQKALKGLKSIKLTAAQEFRIQEQRSNYEALMRDRANRSR